MNGDQRRKGGVLFEALERIRNQRKGIADFRQIGLKGDDIIEDEWSSAEGTAEHEQLATNRGAQGHVIVTSTEMTYSRVNSDTAVVYVPVSNEKQEGIVGDKYRAFGVKCTPFQMMGEGQTCITIPVYKDKIKGMSQMIGLTGRCVCLACISAYIKEAKTKGEEVSQYVYKHTTVPHYIEMRQTHTPGWAENMGNV